MSILKGVGLQFEETMSGFLGLDETDPRDGAKVGKQQDNEIRFDVQILIEDLSLFLNISEHEAKLSGTITFEPVGTIPIREGRFNLFSVDPETGMRQMVYRFKFSGTDDQTYFFHGHKEIYDDRGQFDLIEDMTRLFTKIYRGDDDQAPIYGAGELYFKLLDGPSMVASMGVTGTTSIWQKVAAYTAFMSFATGALRDEYLKDLLPFYDTQYENLVLSGYVETQAGTKRPFFMVSGEHDKGFPWGDGETFWDVMLAVGDDSGGYQRYCMTHRVLEGLELDVKQGTYRYQGPLFALETGHSASFSEMRSGAEHLVACDGDIQIAFDAKPYESVSLPFEVLGKLVRKLPRSLRKNFREAFPFEYPLGINITPHTVIVREGKLSIKKLGGNHGESATSEEFRIIADQTFGEAERSTFRNVKEPTMLYGYICGVQPTSRVARVQIHSSTLRNEKANWIKDRVDALLGTLVSRTGSKEYLMEGEELKVKELGREGDEAAEGNLFVKLGDPILEINNNHYPTAVFQRRIIKVRDPAGVECLALEEDMELMRLDPINSDKKVTVASIKDAGSKFGALDRVLEETGFDSLVEERLSATGKSRAEFSIVIKPNFMFAYNKRDQTTFTDPELVGHLVKHLRGAGFEKVAVVEAQSTYGEYFEKRSVNDVAAYLGYDGKAGYDVIDMTKDALDKQDFGQHLGLHPVSSSWRDADFRISFAKNKTHAYSYYTLTLKNIYGALPMGNKFKEYHCERDIYHTTLEYLTAFPVHYGLVDAYFSADGPFGIFADTRPNLTYTIIGGPDLVAVDWIGASKMGIDPMISKYMQLAVEQFGKPEIELIGDGSQYRPWLNVPVALTLFTHKGLDAEYHFGNLFYSTSAQMDETHFHHKSRALHIRILRKLTDPMRRMFFVRTGENPSLGNRIMSWLLYKLGY